MKILRLLTLFFLGILFVLVLPHFHDRALADYSEIDPCISGTFASGWTNTNNAFGVADGNLASFSSSGGNNAYYWCNIQPNKIATASAVISVEVHQLSYFSTNESTQLAIEDIHNAGGCNGTEAGYPGGYSAGTTLQDRVITYTPANCSSLTSSFVFSQPEAYGSPDSGGHMTEIISSQDPASATSGAVDAMWVKINYAPLPSKPLIFIPGAMGSEFQANQDFTSSVPDCNNPGSNYSFLKGETLWVNFLMLNDYGSSCSNMLDVLKLQSDGQTPAYSQVGLSGMPSSPVYNDGTDNSTLPYLIKRGYTLNQNLFVFPFDWRKDIDGNMTALNNAVSQIIATASAGTTQVDILTHSMGGLVARDYISDTTRASKVNTLVELAPPHEGAPQMLANLLYPTCIRWLIDNNLVSTHLTFLCAINQNEAYNLVQNFTGAFELLPSKRYYTDLYPSLYPINDTLDMDHNGVKGPLNFDQTRTLLANLGKNTTASRSADLFHDSLDSNFSLTNGVSNTNGVTDYLFAGSGIPTIGQLFDYVWSGSGQVKHDAYSVDGDGTVPLKSATLNQTSNVYYAHENHGGLAMSGPALSMAVNLLGGQTSLISGVQTTPFSYTGQIISVHSPAQLNATDSASNHTGKNSDGTYEEAIPGSEYYELGDAKFIYLPSGGTYNITTKATAAGNFDLKVKNYTNSQLDKQTLFLNVSQTASTTASMNLATTSAVLSVDVNGDGTNIQQVSPNYTLTGNSATDSAAPITTSTLSSSQNSDGSYNNPVTVTLSATASAGFTVTSTNYTLDGGSQQTYSSPFSVSGAGNHTVVYWSVDSAGLTEAQNTKTFTISSTPVLVQKNFQNQYSTSNASVAFTSNVTTGNTVIVALTQWNTTISSVTDNHSNTYTAVTSARHANSSTDYVQLYYAKNVTGGSTTVTVNFSGTHGTNVGIYEYSGLDPVSPLEQLTSNTGNGTAPNGGTLATATDNELYFAVGVDDNGNNSAPSAGSGYTLENHQDDSTNLERFYTEDRISAHGSYSTNFTIGTGSNWAVIGASFKPAGSSISLRAASSGNNTGGGTTLVINKPTGTVSGDVMVAHVVVGTVGNTITSPTGWALIRRQDSSSSISTATYWKLAGSSEPSNYTWTFSTSGEASGGIASYVGVNTTNPIDASNAQFNSSTSTVSNAGVTTTAVNDMLVYAVGITVPTTVNVPAGFHEEWSTTSSTSTTSEMSDKIDPVTGATGTISGSHNGGANSNITHLIALRPAGATVTIAAVNLTKGHSETSASSYTTASISPGGNNLDIVTVITRALSGTAPTPTLSGAGGTWVQIATTASGDGARRVTMFRDLSTSPGSGALTISYGGTNIESNAWSVDEFSGTDTTGTHGSGAIVQSQSNTATSTQSGITVTLNTLGSSNNAVYGGMRWSSSDLITKGSGFTELANILVSGSIAYSTETEWAINKTAVNWTWPSNSGTSVALAIEIKAQ